MQTNLAAVVPTLVELSRYHYSVFMALTLYFGRKIELSQAF